MAGKAVSVGYKCYVANLPWTVAHRQLKEYFSQFGHVVEAKVIFDKSTGMSKNFGFVTFYSKESLNLIYNKQIHMLEGNVLLIQNN